MENVPQRDDRASRTLPESGNDESESDSCMMFGCQLFFTLLKRSCNTFLRLSDDCKPSFFRILLRWHVMLLSDLCNMVHTSFSDFPMIMSLHISISEGDNSGKIEVRLLRSISMNVTTSITLRMILSRA